MTVGETESEPDRRQRMSPDAEAGRKHAEHERLTRRIFLIWAAGYVVALALLGSLYMFGGGGVVIDAGGIRVQQAHVVGGPQSSLADRLMPLLVGRDSEG